jgi:ABC-type transport system substrate-binding protein
VGFLQPTSAQKSSCVSYLVRLLEDLGYRATLRPVPFAEYFAKAYNSRAKIQKGIGGGWGLDYPAPSTFYLPRLSCRSFYQDHATTPNSAGFCDPHLDNLASQAQAAQLTDPAAARSRWEQVDRIATDQAPYVPVCDGAGAISVASRVTNCQGPLYAPLLDQIWVR